MNISFAFISFLIMAFVSVILGSIVFLKDTKRKRNIYFFLLTICIAVWILANFLENEKIGLFWSSLALRIDFIAAPLVSLFFILFCLNFPEEGKIPKSVIAGLYLLTSFFCIAATTNLIVGNFVFVHEKLIYSTGNLYLPYALFHIFLMSFGALVILMNLFKYKGAQRTQSAYVFFGFSFSAATILALNLILEQIVFIPREIARFGIYSLLVFETLTAYAITKHELMDIRVVITRAMAYGVVVFSLVASFVGFNLLKLPLAVGILGNVLLGLFWAYAAHRLREFVQTPLEEKWITGWYDSDRLINTIARKLVPVMERQEAFEITADELKSAIKIKKVDILTGSECPDIKEVRRVGKGVEIPLISSEGLEGVLRLGEKVSEDPYDDKDLRLFQTLQVQILSILDRIRPYQKIRKEFEANQKKLYDAEIELERSRRLLSLGTLTAGVTHEIRNPLSVIRSESDRLADKTRDLKYLEEHRDLVAAQVKRIDSIVNRSLGLAKGEKSDKSSINLNDAIEAALQSMVLSSNVKLEKDLKAVPLIQGNADELRQVFDNLIHNAVRAMPDGGLIKLRTYLEDGQVAVQISDDGAGIPKEIQGKIFDPFFSTRHEGAGLGLSIAFQIMQYHGGTIQLESSTVGKGTTFLLSFPSAL